MQFIAPTTNFRSAGNFDQELWPMRVRNPGMHVADVLPSPVYVWIFMFIDPNDKDCFPADVISINFFEEKAKQVQSHWLG